MFTNGCMSRTRWSWSDLLTRARISGATACQRGYFSSKSEIYDSTTGDLPIRKYKLWIKEGDATLVKMRSEGTPFPETCASRYRWLSNHPLKNGEWTQDEDQLLITEMSKDSPPRFAILAKELGRTAESVRQRWLHSFDYLFVKADGLLRRTRF